jgi:hypothetical protein
LLWRLPGQDVQTVAEAAKSAGLYVPGDKVISMEWLSDDPMPAPRWIEIKAEGWLDLNERERECSDAYVMKRAGNGKERNCGWPSHDQSLVEWTNAELLYFIFRVET